MTDRVYSVFFDAVDYDERVVVIMLDEIDKLVEKAATTPSTISRMNSELENSRVSIIGISNDLKFTDFLDPRVKSSLGEEEIVFPPYDANQLRDILQHRSEVAFKGGALSDDVIPLCAAFAAQEHGDARRALDLLRTAGELAERAQSETIVEEHVRQAQDKIELDRVVEVVRTLPTQSKLVLFSIILLEKTAFTASTREKCSTFTSASVRRSTPTSSPSGGSLTSSANSTCSVSSTPSSSRRVGTAGPGDQPLGAPRGDRSCPAVGLAAQRYRRRPAVRAGAIRELNHERIARFEN